MRLVEASPQTIEQYRVALRTFDRHAGGVVAVEDLTDDLVMGAMAWIVSQGRTAATANKFRAHMLALWRYAVRRKLIHNDPDVPKLREPKRVPTAWTTEEMGRILDTAALCPGHICDVLAEHWWQALILVLYDTGLRLTPVMAAQWSWLEIETGRLRVPAEFQKQKADQVPPLSVDCLQALDKIRQPERPMIFPWPFDRGSRQWSALTRRLRRSGPESAA